MVADNESYRRQKERERIAEMDVHPKTEVFELPNLRMWVGTDLRLNVAVGELVWQGTAVEGPLLRAWVLDTWSVPEMVEPPKPGDNFSVRKSSGDAFYVLTQSREHEQREKMVLPISTAKALWKLLDQDFEGKDATDEAEAPEPVDVDLIEELADAANACFRGDEFNYDEFRKFASGLLRGNKASEDPAVAEAVMLGRLAAGTQWWGALMETVLDGQVGQLVRVYVPHDTALPDPVRVQADDLVQWLGRDAVYTVEVAGVEVNRFVPSQMGFAEELCGKLREALNVKLGYKVSVLDPYDFGREPSPLEKVTDAQAARVAGRRPNWCPNKGTAHCEYPTCNCGVSVGYDPLKFNMRPGVAYPGGKGATQGQRPMQGNSLKLPAGGNVTMGDDYVVLDDNHGSSFALPLEDIPALRHWLIKQFPEAKLEQPTIDELENDPKLPEDVKTLIYAYREGMHEKAYATLPDGGMGLPMRMVYDLLDEAMVVGAQAMRGWDAQAENCPAVEGGHTWVYEHDLRGNRFACLHCDVTQPFSNTDLQFAAQVKEQAAHGSQTPVKDALKAEIMREVYQALPDYLIAVLDNALPKVLMIGQLQDNFQLMLALVNGLKAAREAK